MKTFKLHFPMDLVVIMSILCSEHSTQLEAIFFSDAFLVVVIHQYFLFVYMQKKTYIAFTCVVKPLIPDGNKTVTHTKTNLQVSAAGLLYYV